MPGAVHERWGEQRLEAGVGFGDEVVDRGGGLRSTEALDHRVTVSPHHALGHAGGATGVEHVQVVRAPLDVRAIGRGCSEGVFVPDSAGQQRVPGLVGHLQDHAELRQLVEHLGERRRERRVDDDSAGLRVVEQVQQFFGDVAVVDVERCHPGLQRTEHRLEVFVAVVEVDREVILPALVSVEIGALGGDAEAFADQVVGESPSPLGDVRPREALISEDQAVVVRARASRSPRAPRRGRTRPEMRSRSRRQAGSSFVEPGVRWFRWRDSGVLVGGASIAVIR